MNSAIKKMLNERSFRGSVSTQSHSRGEGEKRGILLERAQIIALHKIQARVRNKRFYSKTYALLECGFYYFVVKIKSAQDVRDVTVDAQYKANRFPMALLGESK